MVLKVSLLLHIVSNRRNYSFDGLNICNRPFQSCSQNCFVMFACLSVRPHGKISAPTGEIFVIFDLHIFRKSVQLLKFQSNLIRITGS